MPTLARRLALRLGERCLRPPARSLTIRRALATNGCVVLVVEDDTSIRELICESLIEDGFGCESVEDGQEAVWWTERRRPDVVVLDIGLPRLDGYAVAEALRRNHGDVPIIVVTASGRAAEAARRVGAVGYLPKPFDLHQLSEMVRSIFPGKTSAPN